MTITDQELHASLAQVPAGLVLLTVINQTKTDSSVGLCFSWISSPHWQQ
jgi:hypothetical protein